MRKKFLSIVLCVCMMLTMVPFAFAAEGTSNPISTSEELVQAIAAANDGDTITLGAGTFTTYGKTSPSKKLTFIGAGSDKTVWNIGNIPAQDKAGEYNCDYSFDSCDTITFKNMKMVNGTKDYMGFARIGNLNFEHCMFEGRGSYWGYQSTTFNNCIFTAPAGDYAITDYTSTTMTFNNCTFNSASGKFINAYGEQENNGRALSFTDCTFNAGKKNKPAVCLKSYKNTAWTLNITQCTTNFEDVTLDSSDFYTDGKYYSVRTSDNNGTCPSGTIVTVDGKTVWKNGAPAVEVAEVNGTTYTSLEDAITAANSGDTVTLLNNIEGMTTDQIVTVGSDKNIILNMNGKHITVADSFEGRPIVNEGTLTVTGNGVIDSSASEKGGYGAINNKGTLTIEDGTFAGAFSSSGSAIRNTGAAAVLTVNGGTFEKATCAIYNAGTATINDGTFTGTSCSQCNYFWPYTVRNAEATGVMVINGGTVIGTQGAVGVEAGKATINGGHFKTVDCKNNHGAIFYALAVAGEKNKAEAVINGGIFETDGQYGTVLIGNDVEGDGGVTAQATAEIKDGTFKAPTGVSVVNRAQKTGTVAISGGYFTSDPSDYCVSGKTGIPSDKSGYAFMVGTANTTVDVTPVTGTPAVDKKALDSLNVSNSQKDEIKTAAGNVTDTSGVLAAAAKQEAGNVSTADADKAKEDLEKVVSVSSSETVNVYVQTYLAVTPTNAEVSSDASTSKIESITLDIQPMSRVVASTATKADDIQLKEEGKTQNAVILEGSVKPINIQNMTISIALPSSFNVSNNTVYVQHKGYEYTATVENNVATFTNPHGFSEFTISTTSQTVATIGGTNYTSLQDAVNAANDGETITVTKDSNLTASMSGSSKTIKVMNGTTESSITVTINGTAKEIAQGETETFTYTRPSHNSSGSTTYAVNVNAATNGAVAADKKTAAKGTTVTVTATPSAGYVVDSVKVVDKDGKDVAVSEKDGKYVFTMPASAVTVTASFKAETPAPSGLPFVDVKSGDWFYDAVKYAYENGLMNGTGETVFAPNGTMNRAMIVTVLYRLEKSPAVTTPAQFKDVPAGQWYSDAVAWAAANHIVNGYDETTFGPLNAVTREQMAAILYRYEQYKGMDTVTLEENLSRFPDKDKVSAYAVPAMQWAVGQKVINGNADGTLDPTGTATRAQVAQIFSNLLNK